MKDEMDQLAYDMAREANEDHFESRRGVVYLEDVDLVCIYNNNPYARSPLLRERELHDFRQWLTSEGIDELGFASYPTTGEAAGYTVAMVIDAREDDAERIADKITEITARSFEWMDNNPAGEPASPEAN